MSDEQKEPRPACWPFDPNPPRLAKSTNGFVWCPACESPQPVAGHECATTLAESVIRWLPALDRGDELKAGNVATLPEARTPMEIAAEQNLSEWAKALTERIASLRDQLDAIREALDEWARVDDESLAVSVIRLRHAYEAPFRRAKQGAADK